MEPLTVCGGSAPRRPDRSRSAAPRAPRGATRPPGRR